MSSSPHGVSRQDIRMYTQEFELSTRDRNLARLPIVHRRGPTLNTGLEFGKTSECGHKRFNSQHGIVNFDRFPNVDTRGPTLRTG
ncbi:hypothetical protein PoB_001077700 [Plakobranchus ocellatus]|uniref:Uncharacterized protein n=1 Tax=Plakobranchus ocellatus TaxID=259542 RepID=A0AAV3YMV2_9GAST|nr:hypothetical protein PoB_001077700 [Plakobranchus ocellatus]